METRAGHALLLTALLTLVSGGRAAAINKRPVTGIEPFVCPSKSGQSGICMFAWHCLLFKGTHLDTCFDGIFVGSCCDLPPSNSTTTNEVLPNPARPEPVTSPRPTTAYPTLDWRPVTSTSVVTSMFTSGPPSEEAYALDTSTTEEPTSTTEWDTTEAITPETTEETTEEEDGSTTTVLSEPERTEVGSGNEQSSTTTESDMTLRTSPSTVPPVTQGPTTPVPTTSRSVTTTTSVPVTTARWPVNTTMKPRPSSTTTVRPKPSSTTTVGPSSSTERPQPSSTTTVRPSSSTARPKPSSSTTVRPRPSSTTTPKISTAVPEVTTLSLPNRTTEALQNYREVCGKPHLSPRGRIVGGSNSHYAAWPWMISLRQWKKSTFLHKCGAALLNGLWAITAAHCVESVPPGDILLRLGEYDISNDKEPENFEERRVQIVASHPKFDPRTFEYDLALLRLYQPVRFGRNILPICIPQGEDFFVGKNAFVTGWGRLYEDGPLPSVMQEVQVPVITNNECETMYKKAGFVEDIPDIFICAGKAEGEKDSCEGDSGGPMVLKDAEGRWTLAGIISWGIGCALPNQPGVYTRITKFASWIEQIIAF